MPCKPSPASGSSFTTTEGDSGLFTKSDLSALYAWGRKHGWRFTARATIGGYNTWVAYQPNRIPDENRE